MCKVSIIVPIYDVEKYLHQCIDSILNQTYTDFECILVDDGSPDRCGEICDEYAKKDKRVIVIHQKNSGVSDARNAGIDIAQGKYIYFVDSDDYLDQELLYTTVNKMEKNSADVLCFNFRMVNTNNEVIGGSRYPQRRYSISSETEYIELLCKDIAKIGWSPCTRLFRTDLIKKSGVGFYDRSEIFAEDLLFFMLILVHAKNIQVIDEVLYNYVEREGSCTVENHETRINEFVKLCSVYYKYLKENKLRTLIKKYYIIFYIVMSNRYRQSGIEDILYSIAKVEDKRFYRRNLISIVTHANEIVRYLPNINRNALIYENMQYYLYSSNSILFKAARKALGKMVSHN